jgi:hypothetical protein
MRIIDWIKRQVDIRLEPAEEPKPRSYRYKAVAEDDGKVLFVYGRTEAEARGRIPSSRPIANFEFAGYVEDGVTHYPTEELRAVMKTMQDGRKAPGA